MLNVNIQSTRTQLGAIDVSQLLYMLVKVTPPTTFMESRMPLNIALVIDRSTSMKGERLAQVKRATAFILDKLSADDLISVVVYSDRAEVVLPASNVTNKAPILSKVRGIMASGGTEIYQGLHAGIKELKKADLTKHLNHLVLLTDGHTYGDEKACLQIAENAGKHNIGVTAFGIGSEWNDQFLDKLVAPSGGQSNYIESPDQIVEYLQRHIHNLGAVYAHDVHLNLEALPLGIKTSYALKLKPHAQPIPFDTASLPLGIVEGNAPLLFLLELDIPPQPVGTTLDLPLNFTANIPTEGTDKIPIPVNIQLPVISGEPEFMQDNLMIEAVRILNLYRMNEKAWHEMEDGQVDKATQRMRRLTTRLLQSGFTKLATQAQLETQRLERVGSLSEDGRKKIKYGTRALLAQAISLDES